MTAEQRAALTEAERAELHETSDHAPWHYTEFGVSCSCGLAIIDHDRDYCQTMINLEALVERILADRAAADVDPDLGVMAPRCPDCGWQADERPDDAAGRASAQAEVVAHLAGHRAAAEDHGLRAAHVLNSAADDLEGRLGTDGAPRNLYEFRLWLRNRAALDGG